MSRAKFRKDYDGEFVILETKFVNGVKQQQREWIPNAIENHHISGRAAAIGSRVDEYLFGHQRLQKHRGGLLGKKRMQTYGTGDIWQDMTLDFYVSNDLNEIDKIYGKTYHQGCTVYSNAKACFRYPGSLYLTPFSPNLDDAALVLYLAAFDHHQEIYMLGYNREMPMQTVNTLNNITTVMRQYPGCQFTLVGVAANMHREWLTLPNVIAMTHRQFISHCDV